MVKVLLNILDIYKDEDKEGKNTNMQCAKPF
jgi:hypothetical protein